jgi:hypothetical protein
VKKYSSFTTRSPTMLINDDFAVEDQLKIVNMFFEKKLQDLQHSLDPLFAKPANPTRQGWIQSADELAIRLAQLEGYACKSFLGKKITRICVLNQIVSEYTHILIIVSTFGLCLCAFLSTVLNYEGFRKILKKHDKNCQVPMMQSFLIDLQHNEHSFWKQSEQLRSWFAIRDLSTNKTKLHF